MPRPPKGDALLGLIVELELALKEQLGKAKSRQIAKMTDQYLSPPQYLQQLEHIMGGSYEDMAPYHTCFHPHYYFDALSNAWPCFEPHVFVYVNPPFSLAAAFLYKALLEVLQTGIQVALLIPTHLFTARRQEMWKQVEALPHLEASY